MPCYFIHTLCDLYCTPGDEITSPVNILSGYAFLSTGDVILLAPHVFFVASPVNTSAGDVKNVACPVELIAEVQRKPQGMREK